MAMILRRDVIAMMIMLQFLGACSSSFFARSSGVSDSVARDRFEQWVAQHGKKYSDEANRENRYKIFRENLQHVEDFNRAGNTSFRLGLNQFSDLTTEEFRATYTITKMTPRTSMNMTGSFRISDDAPVPECVNWVEAGVVTGIRNQGTCGCCWALAAVAAIESIIKMRAGELLDLSEQQLLDCVTDNAGCEGGTMVRAYQYVLDNKISGENQYPYRGAKEDCAAPAPLTQITGFRTVTPSSEADLLRAVAQQPVSVGITASDLFRAYKDGIFRGTDCRNVQNHAVTIVGYGIAPEDGSKYWLLKNSWGDSWGEGGYMRIAREVPDLPQGVCGLATDASFPY
ncbi:hypothetical protein CRG98_011256 [Punica granatum]|nr:hypothetical protein CRG98_011256 [Punica granatum]